jgi:hypothetical protein
VSRTNARLRGLLSLAQAYGCKQRPIEYRVRISGIAGIGNAALARVKAVHRILEIEVNLPVLLEGPVIKASIGLLG